MLTAFCWYELHKTQILEEELCVFKLENDTFYNTPVKHQQCPCEHVHLTDPPAVDVSKYGG